MSETALDLYEFPQDFVGRKTYVSVRGYARSIPAYKTYRGYDSRNWLRPEYGGSWEGLANRSALDVCTTFVADKAGYLSPMDGKYVEGYSAHREHMKVHGTIEAGDMKMGEIANTERPTPGGIKHDIRKAISELGA
jgi:hypothetical protein